LRLRASPGLVAPPRADPPGAVIAHRCQHRDCVKLAHLYLSDPVQRVADTTAAGRMQCGEDHWNHKLTWDAVHLTRESQDPTDVLADRYRVAPATITRYALGDAGVTHPSVAVLRGEADADVWKPCRWSKSAFRRSGHDVGWAVMAGPTPTVAAAIVDDSPPG
jgi:hypothetical protein